MNHDNLVTVFADNFGQIDKRVDHLAAQCVDRLTQQGFPRSAHSPHQPSTFSRHITFFSFDFLLLDFFWGGGIFFFKLPLP